MDVILIFNIAGFSIGLIASTLTIMHFFKEKFQHKVVLLIVLLITTATIVGSHLHFSEQRHQEAMKQMIKQNRTKDAETVARSIVITGWEDVGDYIGYLGQITGFYCRHQDIYQTEYGMNARALSEWQDHLKKKRENGETWRSSDYGGLKGLVKSGQDHIGQIASVN